MSKFKKILTVFFSAQVIVIFVYFKYGNLTAKRLKIFELKKISPTTVEEVLQIKVKTAAPTKKKPPAKRVFLNMKGNLGEDIPYSIKKPDEEIRLRFQRRLDRLEESCPSESKTSPKRTQWFQKNLLVAIPEKRVVVCVVGKSGSTNWRELAWKFLRIKLNKTGPYHFKYITPLRDVLTNLKPEERDRLMKEIPKLDRNISTEVTENQNHRLVLARHPFGRLISAWHEKFRLTSNYGLNWLKKSELLRSYKQLNSSDHDMAWEDFARYIADKGTGINVHFMPISKMCDICNIAYTYVVKTESFDEDALWMMKRLNISEHEILHRNIPPEGSLVNENPTEAIGRMISKLSKEVVQKLYKIYQGDFKYLGYKYDIDNNVAGGFEMD